LTRRDCDSYKQRYFRYENHFITLIPVDENQPRLGGKVKANAFIMDWRTFTPQIKTLYGIYSDDFLTMGEFTKEAGNPLEKEDVLLKIAEEGSSNLIATKTLFRFENNRLYYRRDVNESLRDLEVEHPIKESEITPLIDQTWTEVFFYGIGNKHIAKPTPKRGQ